jgi:hypothetical protein
MLERFAGQPCTVVPLSYKKTGESAGTFFQVKECLQNYGVDSCHSYGGPQGPSLKKSNTTSKKATTQVKNITTQIKNTQRK